MKTSSQAGQALLSLIVIVSIAFAVIAGATALTLTTLSSGNKLSLSEEALIYAQSGIDLAVLQLLRNPSYSGEVFTLDGNTVMITVSGSSPLTIESEARAGLHRKKIRVTGTYQNLQFTPESWLEIQ